MAVKVLAVISQVMSPCFCHCLGKKYCFHSFAQNKTSTLVTNKPDLNVNIIKHVTDFKYLGYHIPEYKSDLEDKLQTYNKINGAIRKHFGK